MVSEDAVLSIVNNEVRRPLIRVRFVFPSTENTVGEVVEMRLPSLPRNSERVCLNGRVFEVYGHEWCLNSGAFDEYILHVDVLLKVPSREF